MELTGGNELLRREVLVALRLSRFAARCDGRRVTLVLAYMIRRPIISNLVEHRIRTGWEVQIGKRGSLTQP